MFTITLGFTSDTEKAPVILAGPDVPYQKQEEDMNAAAVADAAPSVKGSGPITRAEIWHSNRAKQTFSFQDPAVKEMLLQQQKEAQARAEEAAEAHRQTQLANLRAEVERLEAPERKAAEEAERIRLEAEAIEAARIAEEEAAKKAEKEAEELKALEAEIAAEEAVKETPSEKSKPKGK